MDKNRVRRRRMMLTRAAAFVAAYMVTLYVRSRLQRNRERITYVPIEERDRNRIVFLNNQIYRNDITCQKTLRLMRSPFFRLCQVLRECSLLHDTIHICIEEQVAMFLITVGHNLRNRLVGTIFNRSGEMVCRYFGLVLHAIGELRGELIRPPSLETPTKIAGNPRWDPYFKDHRSDADFLNTPIEHYHEMATIFGNGMASGVYAKSGSESLGMNLAENENENANGGSDPFAGNVDEFPLPFTIPKRGSSAESSCSKQPKKAKVSNDDELIGLMTRSLDNLAKAIEKSGSSDTDVPEDLWDNLTNLPGFEEAHLTYYYAHLVENPAIARAFNKLSMSNKMIWVARYIRNHLFG